MKKLMNIIVLCTSSIFLAMQAQTIELVQPKKNNVNQADRYGWTLLMYASCNGQIDKVKDLLDQGASVNVADQLGKTSCWYATRHGHENVVEVLVKAGAHIKNEDHYGNSAYSLAQERSQISPQHDRILSLFKNVSSK